MANRSTLGQELLQQIADGKQAAPASEFLTKTREEVSNALEELIEIGARIRPLLVEGKRVGWVRGIHLSERKHLKRWLHSETEFITELLRIGTSLTTEEILDLTMVELRSITRVIRAMTDSDMRLFPYLGAFVTTSMSEQLWYSRGREVTSFRDRVVTMPGSVWLRANKSCGHWEQIAVYGSRMRLATSTIGTTAE